ncbi:MAG: prepilin peptidase [Chloroflexi bacterium]|nr:prepilin peptidase [Chloroflexota bacterium]
MDYLGLFFATTVGLAVGSFVNVVGDRLPVGQSIAYPPSHCPDCDAPIRRRDLIPVVSYVLLRGKCRDCSAKIPIRVLLIEIVAGLLFAGVWLKFGWSYQGVAMMGYVGMFLAIFVVDLEHHIIPNRIVFPGLVVALVIASFWPEVGLAKAAIGASAGFGLMLLLYLIPGIVIGEGDVKLAAVVGAAVGFPVVFVSLGLSFVLGGVAAAGILLVKKGGRKTEVPFGPFIAVAALVSLIWGAPIMAWYVSSFVGIF